MAMSHRLKQLLLFRGLRKAEGSTLWSPGGMKWPDCCGLRQIAARESWLSHQEARLLRFRPNVHASEKKKRTILIAWSSGYIRTTSDPKERKKTTDVAKEAATQRTQEPLADVGRDSPLLFRCHTATYRSHHLCARVCHIAGRRYHFLWRFSDDCYCWHAARRSYCTRFLQWVSFLFEQAYDSMNSLALPILRLRHRNHWRLDQMCF